MNSIQATVAGVLFVLFCSNGNAEDVTAKLPEDGWWSRYSVTTKEDREGNIDESTIKYTYSLTGTVTENGEKCRWVETKFSGFYGGKDRTQITKLLVPEKDMLEKEHPLNRLVRGWTKVDDAAAREIRVEPPEPGANGNANRFYETQMVIFPGPRHKLEIADTSKVIEYQRGRLKINEGRKGKIDIMTTGRGRLASQILTSHTEFTVWTDPAVRLGLAAATFRKTTSINNVLRLSRDDDWVIDDFGSDAKSELPEDN
jgi:hypothetical protein